MPVHTEFSDDKDNLLLHVSGYFDANYSEAFRRAYENTDAPQKKYVVDLKETYYMDSSALGMLLILQEYAKQKDLTVELANASDQVFSLLGTVHFDKFFTIHPSGN